MSNHETHKTKNTTITLIAPPLLSAAIIVTLALVNLVSPATWVVTAWSVIWWIMTIAYVFAIPMSLYNLLFKSNGEFLYWLYTARSLYAGTSMKDNFDSATKLVSQSLYIRLLTAPALLISFLFMGNTFLAIGSAVVLALNIKAAVVWWGRDKRND